MEISRRLMPLLTELGGWEMIFAINMSRLTALPRFSAGFLTEPDGMLNYRPYAKNLIPLRLEIN
jgi:hypothetical protein